MTAPFVVGIDPSLTATGIATPTGTYLVVSGKLTGLERLRYITATIVRDLGCAAPRLVVVEGFIPGNAQAGVHERGGLWWRLVDALDAAGYPVATIKPAGLKQYATGKGNAGKDAVILAAARRFAWFDGDNNEADALWLAAIGAEILRAPLVDMPAINRKALEKVAWISPRRPA